MKNNVAELYLADVAGQFRDLKRLAEKAIAQLSDDQLVATLDEEANSISALMKHVGGNLRSRFTDFLASDGEKPDRHRDTEFDVSDDTKATIVKRWEEGSQCLFDALESLADDDLAKTVCIREEAHSVVKAVNRAMSHSAVHVGQIVLLAKHFRGNDWKSLSIPRGKPEELNARMQEKRAGL